MNRKQRRTLNKKKNDSEEILSENIFLFNQIPDTCNVCTKKFDKKDKSMATTWRIVVSEEKERVSLFCPTCIESAAELIQQHLPQEQA